jgi:hypothetical protein
MREVILSLCFDKSNFILLYLIKCTCNLLITFCFNYLIIIYCFSYIVTYDGDAPPQHDEDLEEAIE